MNKTTTVKETLQLFWRFTSTRKYYFWAGTIGAGIGVIVADIIPPLLIAAAFDLLQQNTNMNMPVNFHDFLPYLYGYAGLMIAGVAVWRLQVWFVWQYEVKCARDLAIHIFNHLQTMGTTFHANHFGGALVSQSNKLLAAYEKVMDEFTWSVMTGIVSFAASFVVLMFASPQFAVVFAIVCIFYLFDMYRRTKRAMKYDRILASSESQRTAGLADMITNVSTVSSFGREKHEHRLFKKQADHTVNSYFDMLKLAMINDTISQTMTGAISGISFIFGVLAITVFNRPAGILYLGINYTLQLTRRLWEFRRVVRNLNRAFGDANDMTAILKEKPEIMDEPGATQLSAIRGDIKFDAIDFAYPEQKDKLLFHDLSFHIKPGEKVGLVGHSGGGKTTITKLLLRFLEIDGGKILVDNQDIRHVTQTSLRQSIAYVPQEPMLFHRSLADNIAYGRPEASPKEIEIIAKLANANDFISDLPAGYDTLVGERGVKLSGGQRQRIAIARAMLKNAPILLLDEATSALDSESEGLIQDALWKLMENRTAIVIAHRLSTIQRMDRIIVLDHGEIVEEGSHKELIRLGGSYADLWNRQSGGFIDE